MHKSDALGSDRWGRPPSLAASWAFHFPWQRMRSLLLLLGGVVGAVGTGGDCSGDTTGPAPRTPSQLYWALQLNQRAVNLALTAPSDTFRLTATAVNAAGGALTGVRSATYSSSDSTVTVDSTGLLTAHYVTTSGQNTQVSATLTLQGETLTDTVVVHVTATLPASPLTTFSIQPVAGDSAKESVDTYGGTIPIHVADQAGNALSFDEGNATDYVAVFSSSNPSVATIDPAFGTIQPQSVGHVTFFVATWAYGVAKRDSLPYVIGYPINAAGGGTENSVASRTPLGHSTPLYYFSPPFDTIGVGGGFQFGTNYPIPVDVVFEDSTAVLGGNIPALEAYYNDTGCDPVPPRGCLHSISVTRMFPVAGTYRYHSALIGASGTIVVSAGP